MEISQIEVKSNRPPELTLPEDEQFAAWEEIAHGRFKPRRIRGSYLGRELG